MWQLRFISRPLMKGGNNWCQIHFYIMKHHYIQLSYKWCSFLLAVPWQSHIAIRVNSMPRERLLYVDLHLALFKLCLINLTSTCFTVRTSHGWIMTVGMCGACVFAGGRTEGEGSFSFECASIIVCEEQLRNSVWCTYQVFTADFLFLSWVTICLLHKSTDTPVPGQFVPDRFRPTGTLHCRSTYSVSYLTAPKHSIMTHSAGIYLPHFQFRSSPQPIGLYHLLVSSDDNSCPCWFAHAHNVYLKVCVCMWVGGDECGLETNPRHC